MFKEKFKYYKSKCPPPDLTRVISLNTNSDKVERKDPVFSSNHFDIILEDLGLIPPSRWNIQELKDHPGLIIIQNPFTNNGACMWIKHCLTEYPGPPNKCNLHNHKLLLPDENWWDVCHSDAKRKQVLHNKLRWVTLGYHHNWDTKVIICFCGLNSCLFELFQSAFQNDSARFCYKIYSENNKSDMPKDLVTLVRCIGKVIGNWEIGVEAGIVNYYRMDSTLSGHTDHSEPNNSAPLFSISFGQSAIFLIGGETIDGATSAVLIENGDIVIMSGRSRLCYHGVPRIVKSNTFDDNVDLYTDYLKDARINLNLRQVLNPGQKYL